MGADSQATMMPIKRTVKDKISKICECVLMAGAGSFSQIQKIQDGVNALPIEIKQSNSFEKIKENIKIGVVHQIRKETIEHYKNLGTHPDDEKISENSEIILAGFLNGAPKIYHIGIDAMDTRYDDYCTIGFGTPFAQVILKDYEINNLNVEQGKILTYKVIKDAIETGAFSMDYPISIWVINSRNGKIEAYKLEDSEIDAIRDTTDAFSVLEKEIFMKTSSNKNGLNASNEKEEF